jgi:hypothetical protein
MRALDRALAGLGVCCGIVWAAYILCCGSDAGITVPVLLIAWWGGAALLGLWLLRLLIHVVANRATRERWHVGRALVELALLGCCFALVWSGGAFRVRFLLSRPSLTHFARETKPFTIKKRSESGVSVGLFRIREAEVLPGGIVRLITTQCMFDDCGVVYSPGGRPPVLGEDTYTALGDNWWQWWRSW